MASPLSPLCDALEKSQSDIQARDQMLLQYVEGAETDLGTLCSISHDSHFTILLQFIFETIMQSNFPAPSEGPIPDIQIKCLQYLTELCFNHPDLLSIIASIAPLNELIPTFFYRNFQDDKIVDPQISHLLPVIQFLTAVSCSSAINISSTEAFHYLFCALFSSISVQQLSVWCVAAISNFTRNSTAALSYLKALPNFSLIKRELASLLSSNDHCLVAVVLSAVSTLFSRGIDKETAMQVSVAAVVTPPEYQVITTISASVILQLSDDINLSLKDTESLFKAAMGARGMRAYVIYKLLIEMGGNCHQNARELFQDRSFFLSFLQSILDSEDGFVTIAGANLLLVVFESNSIPLEFDIAQPFSRALQTILSVKFDDIDKLEALLLVVRLIISSRELMTQIVKILQDNEEAIFVSFQRHIESNNSFVSIQFFLFIFSGSHFFQHWLTKLREIVIDSQFSALLVHILQTSQNRRTIDDSLEVLQIIISGIVPENFHIDPTMSYSIASGFYLMNRQRKNEIIANEQKYQILQKKFIDQTEEYAVERELREKEILALKESMDNSMSQSIISEQRMSELSTMNDELLKKLEKKKDKLVKIIEEKKLSEDKLNELTLLANQNEMKASTNSKKTKKLKDKILLLKQVEVAKQEAEKSNDQLNQKIREMQIQIEESDKEIENMTNMIDDEKNSRKNVEKLLNEAQERINQLTISFENEKKCHDDSKKLIQQRDNTILEKNNTEIQLVDSISKLNAEIKSLRKKVQLLETENQTLSKANEKQFKRITDLRKERKELAALAQLIHKITDGNFENMDSIIGMMNSE